MSIPVACPSCGHTGNVPATFNERLVKCPKCGFRFTVRVVKPTPPTPPPAPASDDRPAIPTVNVPLLPLPAVIPPAEEPVAERFDELEVVEEELEVLPPQDSDDLLPAVLPAAGCPSDLAARLLQPGRIVVHVWLRVLPSVTNLQPGIGRCEYCGDRGAGLFRTRHPECEELYEEIKRLSAGVIEGAGERSAVKKQLKKLVSLAESDSVPDGVRLKGLVAGWELAVERLTEQEPLSSDAEENLLAFASLFGLTEEFLDMHAAYSRAGLSCLLRDLQAGRPPSRTDLGGRPPFNLQKNENLVWVCKGTAYYEERVQRSYEGRYGGMSIRVAKGLTLRTGSYKGQRVETSELVHVATGLLGITDKHVYFAGDSKAFRVPYGKIVAFTPYEDGIGLCREAANPKPQVFRTGYGGELYSLLAMLTQPPTPSAGVSGHRTPEVGHEPIPPCEEAVPDWTDVLEVLPDEMEPSVLASPTAEKHSPSGRQRGEVMRPRPVRGLPIRQPYAELIMRGIKTKEYRGRRCNIRERVYVYATLNRIDPEDEEEIGREHNIDIAGLPRGVLVGTVEIYGCETCDDGGFAWLLRNPERWREPRRPDKLPNAAGFFFPFGKPEE
jgi:hypothetical protein